MTDSKNTAGPSNRPAFGNPPPWMVLARTMTGLRETPGPATTPALAAMLAKLHAWWHDDETPWCATFVAHCMDDAGLVIPKAWYRARAWAEWGRGLIDLDGQVPLGRARLITDATRLRTIPYGAVCVLERGSAGHTTFYVAPCLGRPDLFWGLGGNQGDMVKVSAFPVSRILAVRWPSDYPLTDYRGAEVTAMAHGEPSRGEA